MRKYLVPSLSLTCLLGMVAIQDTADASSTGDYFGGVAYSANNKPKLEGSSVCVADRDYSIQMVDKGSPITALAIHGGAIEPNTDLIVDRLREVRGLNSYKFLGHPSAEGECENAWMLHVTASNFNEPGAVDLVERYPASVSVHGYSDRHLANPNWPATLICVGGVNRDRVVNRFIAYLDDNKNTEPQTQEIIPVDARKGADAMGRCPSMQGSGGKNIVNLNQLGSGLQLEFSTVMRAQLASDDPQYAPIQKLIFDAIEYAFAENIAAASTP